MGRPFALLLALGTLAIAACGAAETAPTGGPSNEEPTTEEPTTEEPATEELPLDDVATEEPAAEESAFADDMLREARAKFGFPIDDDSMRAAIADSFARDPSIDPIAAPLTDAELEQVARYTALADQAEAVHALVDRHPELADGVRFNGSMPDPVLTVRITEAMPAELLDEIIALVPDGFGWEIEVVQRSAADRQRHIAERGQSSPLTPTDGEAVYVSTAVDGPSPLDGVTLRFAVRSEDGLIDVRADCNSIGGLHEIRDDRMVVHDMTVTAADCGPERNGQDTWLMTLLAGRPLVTIDDGAFTLTDGTTIVTFTAEPR